MKRRVLARFAPARIILISLLMTIVIGALILALPIARTTALSPLDIIFTSTSAVCVTGQLTIPMTSFTTFGHFIIMILMQIGGLGILTLSLFLISLFVDFGYTTQLMVGQLLELDSWSNIKSIISFIITFTLTMELLGAVCIYFAIYHDYSLLRGLFLALFHSVSAFCDAGFCIFPGGMGEYRENALLLIVITILMLAGGLGFLTFQEILDYFKAKFKKKRYHFSLHSQIVFITTGLLSLCSIFLYWTLEKSNTLEHLSPSMGFLNAVFNAIASRSPGFTTVNVADLQLATLFVIMVIAFIGSSPGSTGSGIKTTTFAIFATTARAAIAGRPFVSIRGRTIPKDQIYKALAIIALSITWVILVTFLLLITEQSWLMSDILFESIAAFATLGLSTGMTPFLSLTGKILIMCSMIIGRISCLTFVLALSKRPDITEYSYPEERIMLS